MGERKFFAGIYLFAWCARHDDFACAALHDVLFFCVCVFVCGACIFRWYQFTFSTNAHHWNLKILSRGSCARARLATFYFLHPTISASAALLCAVCDHHHHHHHQAWHLIRRAGMTHTTAFTGHSGIHRIRKHKTRIRRIRKLRPQRNCESEGNELVAPPIFEQVSR